MSKNLFNYPVHLVKLDVSNDERYAFMEKLLALPYLLYEVETMKNGNKIVINKPGGKRNFGRLSRNDFMVFIYYNNTGDLWLISHDEIIVDIRKKYEDNSEMAIELVKGLFYVCNGAEPDLIIEKLGLKDTVGIDVETLLKVYKWIWGQEDCNYPKQKGRWLSMDGLLVEYGIDKESLAHYE